MIVVDSSALLAIVLEEPEADRLTSVLTEAPMLCMSAATLTEVMIVARRRGVGQAAARLLSTFRITVVSLTEDGAVAAADAYDRFGRGAHKASLNWGDCFSYSLAKALNASLAFVGNDFIHTDVTPA